jgi:molybdopterin biosynthesis enzyme MoaB
MENFKTRIVVVSDTNKVVDNQQTSFSYTTHQLKTKQIEPEVQLEPRTVKQTLENVKETIADTQKIKDLNPFHAYFPSFYKKEIKNTFVNYIV